jgi:hypothetical protein
MKTNPPSRARTPRRLPTADEWERSWQKHWSKVGLPGYELPVGGPGQDDREFFKIARTREKGAFIVMPGGLGTLDELFEAATLIQCRKIGPFPLILMGEKFWAGMREWGQFMMREGVFAKEEIGFAYVTDSPKEAVDLILRSLPLAVRKRLKPC